VPIEQMERGEPGWGDKRIKGERLGLGIEGRRVRGETGAEASADTSRGAAQSFDVAGQFPCTRASVMLG
jgi:hypothetical protein